MGLTVGIDLGTTYTVVSYIDPTTKKAVILKNKYKNSTTPSVIGIRPDGSFAVGEDAKVMQEEGDLNTASFYKLYMGNHSFAKHMYGHDYTAMELSAIFLKIVIEDAEKNVEQKITDAVITVPAYFGEAAKNDTLQAGSMAGLNVLNIINEPTAACVAYGLNDDKKERKILVYDLGGGTFDVTIAEIKEGVIEVIGTNGLHQMGGRDWDKEIADWLVQKFYEETGVDISEDEELSAINMVSAENAKKQLSYAEFCDIKVSDGEHKCKFRLSRREFEDLTDYQLTLTTDVIEQTFNELQIGWEDIDGVILVGGSTKMPMVRNFLKGKGVPILDGVNPDEAVSIGAAIQANISQYCALTIEAKNKSSLELIGSSDLDLTLLPGAKIIKDVISHSLGMIMSNESETKFVNDIMIKRNTRFDEAKTTKIRELRVGKKVENNKLDIYLLQGESEEPLDCSVAKRYVFYNIPFVEAGTTKIEITFFHTYNGVVDVKAVQTETGKELDYRQETIPDDMSWLEGSPKDLYSQFKTEIDGALIMALDLSGSMMGNPLVLAKEAMRKFVEDIIEFVNVGIVGFADSTVVVCKPTKIKDTVMQGIEALEVDAISPKAPINGGKTVGYGNAANPTRVILELLANYIGKSFVYGVVLTDGKWMTFACEDAVASKKEYINSQIELVGMGFGNADIDFLRQMSTRDDLANVGDISELGQNLSTIARIIHE